MRNALPSVRSQIRDADLLPPVDGNQIENIVFQVPGASYLVEMTPLGSTATKHFSRPVGTGSRANAIAVNGAIVNALVLISLRPLLNVKSARVTDKALQIDSDH